MKKTVNEHTHIFTAHLPTSTLKWAVGEKHFVITRSEFLRNAINWAFEHIEEIDFHLKMPVGEPCKVCTFNIMWWQMEALNVLAKIINYSRSETVRVLIQNYKLHAETYFLQLKDRFSHIMLSGVPIEVAENIIIEQCPKIIDYAVEEQIKLNAKNMIRVPGLGDFKLIDKNTIV